MRSRTFLAVGGIDRALQPMPENINFATKNINAREFLDANHIAYDTAPSTTKLDAADVGELAARSVVLVGCGGPDQAAVSVGVSDK